ncbi:hypothetical protein Droror1_Dr00027856 [Drosera rotundifolia]
MRGQGVFPNVYTYNKLIKCFYETGEANHALSLLDEMMENGTSPNTNTFEMLIRAFCGEGNFNYKDLIDELCKDEKADEARDVLKKLISKGCSFDPAALLPAIDSLDKKGSKKEADELNEKISEMLFGDKIKEV